MRRYIPMVRVKRLIVGALLVLAAGGVAGADEYRQRSSGASFGGVVSQVQNDFGFGLEMVSPRFLRGSFAVAATGKLNYVAGADWERYGYGTLSLMAGITSPTPTTNLYGKAGIVGVIPSDDVARDYDVGLGALGAFGFEFFFSEERNGSYFIELGGVGTGAEADAMAGEPIYANGFLANVGVRYYF
jgi:hypothetical protein